MDHTAECAAADPTCPACVGWTAAARADGWDLAAGFWAHPDHPDEWEHPVGGRCGFVYAGGGRWEDADLRALRAAP